MKTLFALNALPPSHVVVQDWVISSTDFWLQHIWSGSHRFVLENSQNKSRLFNFLFRAEHQFKLGDQDRKSRKLRTNYIYNYLPPFHFLIINKIVTFLSSFFFFFPYKHRPSTSLSPCYLSTRPWHLLLRSVALSVALGWWMGWWTPGCYGNLMDGLATDMSTERALQHTHTEHTLLQAYVGPWLWDRQASITNTADPRLQRNISVQSHHHFCRRHRCDEVRRPEIWSKDNSLSVNVNKTKEMIVDLRRSEAWTESSFRCKDNETRSWPVLAATVKAALRMMTLPSSTDRQRLMCAQINSLYSIFE